MVADPGPRGWVRTLRGSVRVRITAAAVAVVGLALLLAAIALVASLHAVLTREVRITATVRAAEITGLVRSGGEATVGEDVMFQVVDPTGAVLRASPNATGLPPLVRLARWSPACSSASTTPAGSAWCSPWT
jgi:hypothetical protein